MKHFKSPWFFWYTGHKLIAVFSMLFSAGMLGFMLAATEGFSIWAIIIAVLLDAVGFWIALIYVLVLRNYVTLIPFFQDSVQNFFDALVMNHLVVPVFLGFFSSRLASFVVAKLGKYQFK